MSLITDDALPAAAIEAIVAQACACAGDRLLVQLRAKKAGGAALLALARRLREMTRASGSSLIVNDRIDVALAAGADGAHLPAAGMPSEHARRLLGPDALLGRSVHSLEEIDRERAFAALDYIQFGPVFDTRSKTAFGPSQGLERLARAVERARPLALVAVGGITATNVGEVMRTGASGAAVIGAVMAAHDPAAATRKILHATRNRGGARG